MKKILIVDDYKDTRDLLSRALRGEFETFAAPDAEGAVKIVESHPDLALVVTDVRMPGEDGVTLLKVLKARRPDLPVILLTAYGSVDLAVDAMKNGAADFITKPIDLDVFEVRVKKVLAAHDLAVENDRLHRELDERYGMENIIGESEAMKRVFHAIRQVAPRDTTVLVEGPNGTGKELVAHALHNLSGRAKGPFLAVNCGAIPESLFESQLFGHERGAFTGAANRHQGFFERAEGGTIFLDEIGELPLAMQVKFLRVLENHTFQRLGGTETLTTNARVVAATNRDLRAAIAKGAFREDLFYRLSVMSIRLPALRERGEDVALLAVKFLDEFAGKGGGPTRFEPDALKMLKDYAWPGNVRQLRNVVERMSILASGPSITADDVPEEIRRTPAGRVILSSDGTLGDMEKEKILAVLAECGGNRTKAAGRLGIARRTLYRKLDEYGAGTAGGKDPS